MRTYVCPMMGSAFPDVAFEFNEMPAEQIKRTAARDS